MYNHFYRPVDNKGSQIDKKLSKDGLGKGRAKITGKVNDELVIEENTIYEIDRECASRARRQRKRR